MFPNGGRVPSDLGSIPGRDKGWVPLAAVRQEIGDHVIDRVGAARSAGTAGSARSRARQQQTAATMDDRLTQPRGWRTAGLCGLPLIFTPRLLSFAFICDFSWKSFEKPVRLSSTLPLHETRSLAPLLYKYDTAPSPSSLGRQIRMSSRSLISSSKSSEPARAICKTAIPALLILRAAPVKWLKAVAMAHPPATAYAVRRLSCEPLSQKSSHSR